MRSRGVPPWAMALAAAGVVLGGCSEDLNEGSKPVGVRIAVESGYSGPINALECDLVQLYALGRWVGDDNYEATVNGRAVWTSDDPAVASVGDGVTLPAGLIIARRAGTTTVHAQFLEFSSTMTITVVPIVETRIRPDTTHLAPGSRQTFRLEVRADTDDGWIAKGASWAIVQSDAPATLQEATVQALTDDNDVPFTLEAALSGCTVRVQRELRVSPVSHLALEYEQPPAQALPLGLTAMIRVLAHFQDASVEPQNLSGQVAVELDDTEEGAARFEAYAEGVVLEGLVEGKGARLSFHYAPLDETLLSERYVFADLEQGTLRVDPVQLTVQYPGDARLQALGTFSDGIERIVTRHVTWTVSDEAVAAITNGVGAGELSVIQDVDQSVQVEAFGTVDDETVTAEGEVQILPADEP